jgi:flagellar motility protein MotE (MotC chaperone)
MDAEMLEFLKAVRDENGSGSRQLEDRARDSRRREIDLKTVEERHRLEYERRPVHAGEFLTLGPSSQNP